MADQEQKLPENNLIEDDIDMLRQVLQSGQIQGVMPVALYNQSEGCAEDVG